MRGQPAPLQAQSPARLGFAALSGVCHRLCVDKYLYPQAFVDKVSPFMRDVTPKG